MIQFTTPTWGVMLRLSPYQQVREFSARTQKHGIVTICICKRDLYNSWQKAACYEAKIVAFKSVCVYVCIKSQRGHQTASCTKDKVTGGQYDCIMRIHMQRWKCTGSMSQHKAFLKCSTCVLCTCMSMCVAMTPLSVSGWKFKTGDCYSVEDLDITHSSAICSFFPPYCIEEPTLSGQ